MPDPSTPAPWLAALRLPHWRLRVTMAVVLVAVAFMAIAQAWQARRAEAVREVDAEVIALAGWQRAVSQQIARLAALSAEPGGEQRLADQMRAAQDQALRLEELLKSQDALDAKAMPSLASAVERWQATRERLWYRTEALLASLVRRDGDASRLAIARVQDEADPMLEAAQVLTTELQSAAQLRSTRAAAMVQSWMVGMLLALGLIAGLVVEPMARGFWRQHLRLARQTVELERLAMVAEHTSNIVIVMDRSRYTLWANPAFERVTGYTLSEAVGRRTVELLHSERTDRAVVERVTAALDAGQGIRVEMLNRTRDGLEFWVDLDVQPTYGPDGECSGFVSVRTVITEQVRQRQQMEALLAALPNGVVLHDSSGRIVECNPAAERVLALTRDELLGRTPADPRWKALRDDLSDYPGQEHPAMRTLATGRGLSAQSMAVRTPAGELRWLLVNTEPIAGAAGQGVIACFVDVTEQRSQQQLLRLTLEGSGVGVWQWDIRTGAMKADERLEQMHGYVPGTLPLTREAWIELVHPDDRNKWFASLVGHLKDPRVPYGCELRVVRPDGHWTPVMSTGTVVERAEDGEPLRMAGIHVDLTDQVRMRDLLRESARTDALTQLPNRTVVLERVGNALARWRNGAGPHFAVLFMDFDRFKQVNDTLGHSAGDELLRQIAQRLQKALRAGDAVSRVGVPEQTAARIGGDEFVVVLEDIRGADDACRVAQRLLELLAQPYTIANTTVHSSASIGIVASEHAADTADAVLRDADTAMYEAKRAGRGRAVLFDAAMHERVARQVSLENDLRAGLDRGELFVVYQPVIDLKTGRACGVEALARWRHPVRGLVPPVEFVPVAEESGLIGAMGDFVLEAACADFVEWRKQLPDDDSVVLAVNLSRAQLRLPGLVDSVRRTLRRAALPPGCLQLEITESLAAQDEQVQATLRDLKAIGVKLALDDFGTGYSSLACLHLLPVDTVKIDRSFVRHAETSEYHRVLIEATIRVAQALGMVVVAEGVETAGQALLLHALRCDKGQGYLFGKPMAASDIPPVLADAGAIAA